MKHIKTVATLLVAILLSTATLFAQTNWSNTDSTWFRHYSVGVSAGTDGVGVSAAVLLGNHLQLRGGYAWFPKTEIKSNPMIDLGISTKKFQSLTSTNHGEQRYSWISSRHNTPRHISPSDS